jgi:nicotinate-nucleotide adenylyltransferase
VKRIVLFGGTFDPVHVGHTIVAHHAGGSLKAERVIFVPARRSPHKSGAPVASAEDRIQMLCLATGEQPSFSVDRCEIERPEPSYTFDTVVRFRARYPEANLAWLVGADMLSSLPRWYRIQDLLELCDICLMSRGGVESANFDKVEASLGRKATDRLRQMAILTPLIPVSSTEIRRRLAAHEDVSEMLHPLVLEYIRTRKLYEAVQG